MTKHEVKAAPIGMRVVVADWLVRYRGNDITGDSRHVWMTIFERHSGAKWAKGTPRNGYLTGYATLQNGTPEYEDFDHGWQCMGLSNIEYVFAARIKFSARGREHYARPEDIKPIKRGSRP